MQMAYERLTRTTRMSNGVGSYRAPLAMGDEIRFLNGALLGPIVDRLGKFEDLGMSPEELARMIEGNKRYQSFHAK